MAIIELPKNTEKIIELTEQIILTFESGQLPPPFDEDDVRFLKQQITLIKPMHVRLLQLREESILLNTNIQLILGNHESTRKLTTGTVRFILAKIRDILRAKHRDNIFYLRHWGYLVTNKYEEDNETN